VKIKILPSALADLDRGRIFYARQSKGIGDYFLDSLFSDIDSLELYAGVHIKVFDFHRLALQAIFPMRCITRLMRMCGVVFRVLDCRQEPEKTAEALK